MISSQPSAQRTRDKDQRTTAEPPIIFFDGVCGLCNWFVDFVLPRDRRQTFRFAPLQGETAREYLSADEISALKTVVLVDESGAYRQSTAVLRVLRRLGGVWPLVGGVLRLIPPPLRDVGYRLVARNRYRIFGKKEACRMPMPDERARFLP